MKLVYWIADHATDARCYSIRTKTKKECIALRQERGESDYFEPRKVTIEYKDSFDLLCQALGEGGAEYSEPHR